MADDKTEDASPHKLEEARKKGQIAKSQDLVSAAVLAAGVTATLVLSRTLISNWVSIATWGADRISHLDGTNFRGTAGEITIAAIGLAQSGAALLFAVMVTALGVSLLQSGFNLSAEPLMPKLKRINPLDGVKRLLSMRGILESLKMLLKAVIMLTVGFFAVKAELGTLPGFSLMNGATIMENALTGITHVAVKLILAAVVVGVGDMAFQKYQFKKQMRMSRQELVDEHKMLEGDPHVKARQRKLRRQLSKRNKLDGVKDARVVVTNPDHYAVALKYRDGGSEIPRVVAKGKNYRAERIKTLARKHQVRIVESPPLARSLFKMVEVGKAIPPTLYLATAEILIMVAKLDRKMAGLPENIPEPGESEPPAQGQ